MISKEMLDHWQFVRVREIPNCGDCVVQRFLVTAGLLTHVEVDAANIDYKARYCYDSAIEAVVALEQWDGVGDPPGEWIKEKVADRFGPGAKRDE